MSEWRDIETAPANRQWWLIWNDDYWCPVLVRCRSKDGRFWEGDWDREVSATRWLDVPEPLVRPTPKDQQKEGEG